jgi:hypothetical protein
MRETISGEEHCWNAMRYMLGRTQRIILELYSDGAFKRLEHGSDRERQALALLLRMAEEHQKTLDMTVMDWER